MPRLAIAAAFAALYVLLDWVSYVYPATPAGLTPWNPQSGLAVAYLLYAGLRGWPAIASFWSAGASRSTSARR